MISFRSLSPAQHMPDIVEGVHAIDDIDIGQPQVGVQNQDLVAHIGHGYGEISHHVGFADTAFTACNRNNSWMGACVTGYGCPLTLIRSVLFRTIFLKLLAWSTMLSPDPNSRKLLKESAINS